MKTALLSVARASAAILLGVAGCTQAVPASQTFNFSRPSDVKLLCLDVPLTANGAIVTSPASVTPLPLARCQTSSADRTRTIQDNLGTHGLRLFAMVPQSDRGELAVVNLHPQFNTGVVDNARTIPGFTFIPVGAVPGAVAIDPRGTVTYVANTGGSDVTAIDNATILGRGTHRIQRAGGTAGQFVDHTLPGSPGDLAVVGRAGRVFLYVLLPNRGSIVVRDVTDPAAPGPIQEVMLAAPAAGGGTTDGGLGTDASGGGGGGGGDAGSDAGADVDSVDGGSVDGGSDVDGGSVDGAGVDGGSVDGGSVDGGMDSAVVDGGGGTGLARPSRIAVDEEGTVYISDERATFIHVLRPDGDTLLESRRLESGVPTRSLAVSPLILPTGERFVYAVTPTDRSLMVLDAATGARLNTNLVLDPAAPCVPPFTDVSRCQKIDPQVNRFDRVPLVGPAEAVTFSLRGMVDEADCATPITPGECVSSTTEALASSFVLRGVHAIVTLATGQSQVIDVYDADVLATNNSPICRQGEALPPFQAHAPRAANVFPSASAAPVLAAAPVLTVNSAGVAVTNEQPHFVPITGDAPCDVNNNYCVSIPTNPVGVRDQLWALTYQGTIPNLALASGQLTVPADAPSTARVRLLAPGAHFCGNGAVAGDLVRIATIGPSVIDPTNADAGLRSTENTMCEGDTCLNTFGTTASPCNRFLSVVGATDEELQLDVQAPEARCSPFELINMAASDPAVGAGELRRRLACCYPQATRFEVRAGNAWVVAGNFTRYAHDVSIGADGQCVRSGPARGRAATGVVYQSPAFSVLIQPGFDTQTNTAILPTTDTQYSFSTLGGVLPLVLDTGSLPVAAEYGCVNQRLYVVDQGRDRLLEVPVAPLDTVMGARRFN